MPAPAAAHPPITKEPPKIKPAVPPTADPKKPGDKDPKKPKHDKEGQAD